MFRKEYVVPEEPFFTDDAEMVADLLRRNWSYGGGMEPEIKHEPEAYMGNGRLGLIYVYHNSRSLKNNTTDYRAVQRNSYVSIKVSCRGRELFIAWCEEIYRIILAYRRAGQQMLNGYTYMEPTSDRPRNDMNGWYSNTIDVKLTTYNKPIRSAGFGDEINKIVEDFNRDHR